LQTVSVFFLGPAADLAGARQTKLSVQESGTVADVRELLRSQFPDLGKLLAHIRIAVNQQIVEDDHRVADGDEIALIPPVSGGEDDRTIWVDLLADPIAREKVHEFVCGDETLGGVVTFEGVTRAENDEEHGQLIRLDYEAYGSMAIRVLRDLANSAQDRFGAQRVAILHRTGSVPPGDPSVIISVATAHRAEAFDACRWLIDTLKTEVPIWKKDVFEDGFTRWVDPTDTQSAGTEEG